MFSNQTYEAIKQRILNNIQADIDKSIAIQRITFKSRNIIFFLFFIIIPP